MSAIDYAKELSEAARKIAHGLEQDELRLAAEMAMTQAEIQELRWLEKDYPEYKEEMSIGGREYRTR